MRLFLCFWKDQRGVTAIEYAIIAGLVSAGLIASFTNIGVTVANKFPSISNALN